MAMIAKGGGGDFEPAPEFTGRAVCVDVTPLKTVQTDFGPKEKFRFAFELDLPREDGSRFCVWSTGMTLVLGDRAALRKFLRGWLGRDLTGDEMKNGFDVEGMLGKPAFLVVVHEHVDDKTYANIAACSPHKPAMGEPLAPSGKFVRACDRENRGGAGQAGGGGSARDSAYKRTEAPKVATGPAPDDNGRGGSHLETKVHVGRYKGTELRELSNEALDKLVEMWLPAAKQAAKPTADDKRLIAALDWYASQKAGASAVPVPEGDECPF